MAITQEDCISATEQRRKGRHLVDLQLHNRQGVGWFKTLLPEHHLEVTCLVDG
jgi:hypothetical protein